jgi:hypothetical protein
MNIHPGEKKLRHHMPGFLCSFCKFFHQFRRIAIPAGTAVQYHDLSAHDHSPFHIFFPPVPPPDGSRPSDSYRLCLARRGSALRLPNVISAMLPFSLLPNCNPDAQRLQVSQNCAEMRPLNNVFREHIAMIDFTVPYG